MSLLTICQNAAKRLGVPVPSAVVGSSDTTVLQMLGLTQQEGQELANRHPWQRLTKEKTFTATATAAQSGAIPDDFDRIVNGSFWNRTQDNFITGPMSPQDWQAIQATVAPNVVEAFRIRGNDLLITPTPTAGDTYAYEYVSTYWVGTAAGTAATSTEFVSDTDVAYVSEDLVTLGLTWRFLRAKGLDYSEAFRTYELSVKRRIDRDGGSPVIMMDGPPDYRGAPRARVPDGNWDLL